MTRPRIIEIQIATAAQFGIAQRWMTDPCRWREYARPRQAAMFLARKLTSHSLPDIGRRFGGRDHTTVIHAIAAVRRIAADDPDFMADVAFAAERALELAEARAPLPRETVERLFGAHAGGL